MAKKAAKKSKSKASKKSTKKTASKKSTKKSSKKSTKKSSKKSGRKSTSRKTSSRKVTATESAPATPQQTQQVAFQQEMEDEHLVLSHLMWILFLVAAAFSAIFTIFALLQAHEDFYGIKALLLLGWAYLFKTFGHRVHAPHY